MGEDAEGRDVGLILQGGGALGAYEFGAIVRLVERGYNPVAVSGVSIGAIIAAAVAGARDGKIIESLCAIWEAITLPEVPFVDKAIQAGLSFVGNRNFYLPRADAWDFRHWTNWYDVAPMRRTLGEVVDFKRIDQCLVRLVVTATDVATGRKVSFTNYNSKMRTSEYVDAFTSDHILASGSLPPSFPMTKIGYRWLWDGGIFDNAPIYPFLYLLEGDGVGTINYVGKIPVIVINLFKPNGEIPKNFTEVNSRISEIMYQNKFWAEYGSRNDFFSGVDALDGILNAFNAYCQSGGKEPSVVERQFADRLRLMTALRRLNIIDPPRAVGFGASDFSYHTIHDRAQLGRDAIDKYLDENGGAFN